MKYFEIHCYKLAYSRPSFHFLSNIDFIEKMRETYGNSWDTLVGSLGLYTYSKSNGHQIWIRKLPLRFEYAVVTAIFHELVHCKNKEMKIKCGSPQEAIKMQRENELNAKTEGEKLASQYFRVDQDKIGLSIYFATLLCPEMYLRRNSSQREFLYCMYIMDEFNKSINQIERMTMNSIDFEFINKIIKQYDGHNHNYSKKLREIGPFIRRLDDAICNKK